LYSLCAIYRLDFGEVLSWYGVRTSQLPVELPGPGSPATHVVWASPENGAATARVTESDLSLEPGSTSFLGHLQRWGGCSIPTLDGANGRNYRYGYIGLNDWSMYPVLQPGSLVAIDDRHRKIASGGWNHEFDRPIYFLEHRDGFACNWCTLAGGNLIVLSHPASQVPPVVYRYPNDIEVVGQVAGIAMLLNSRKPHGPHWRAAQAASPGR
jgi:hypothetical protein